MISHYKYFPFVLILSVIICSFNPKPTSTGELTATALKPYGRYLINSEQHLELISSAAHFGFSFEGNQCTVVASVPGTDSHNYLQYELDGVYQKRVRINGDADSSILITAEKNTRHTIWIYKATEAHTGPIIIKKVTGKNVMVAKEHAGPVIEFIGNSITCGAASDASEIPCGTGDYHDHHNAYYAYGPRVARALGKGFVLSSVSGIGIYRNWNSDGPAMPQVYQKTDFQETGSAAWDFSLFTPKIVSIALGTNDFSNGDGIKKRLPFDSVAFVEAYIKFVQLVKSKYPAAQIVLLSSPMTSGNARITLQNCLSAVKQKVDDINKQSQPTALYFFQPMQPHGCSSHPSVADHAILAKELEPFFKKLLK